MENLSRALRMLKRGGVVIVPTDTVYGFIADASNKKAVDKIYKIKKRPKNKPLPFFVSGIKMAEELAVVDDRAKKMFKKHWPGAYTFVLPIKNSKKTIALRMPENAFLLALIKKFGRPLAQTSANISGQEPLNNIEQIITTFGKNRLVGLIIDGGNIKNAKPSKILDLTKEKLTIVR